MDSHHKTEAANPPTNRKRDGQSILQLPIPLLICQVQLPSATLQEPGSLEHPKPAGDLLFAVRFGVYDAANGHSDPQKN